MVGYRVLFSKQADKDKSRIKQAGLEKKARALLKVLMENPYQNPPPYEKLVGDLDGLYSRRINIQHRLVYQVMEQEKTVRILSIWSHYEF